MDEGFGATAEPQLVAAAWNDFEDEHEEEDGKLLKLESGSREVAK